IAPGHQIDPGARVRVYVGLAAEVLYEVDDDVHATGIGDLECLGAYSDGDLRQTCVAHLGQLVAFDLERRLTDLDAVGRDRQRHQIHRGRSDEAGDEGVGRLVVELVRRGE